MRVPSRRIFLLGAVYCGVILFTGAYLTRSPIMDDRKKSELHRPPPPPPTTWSASLPPLPPSSLSSSSSSHPSPVQDNNAAPVHAQEEAQVDLAVEAEDIYAMMAAEKEGLEATDKEEGRLPLGVSSRTELVHAFYYAWYGNPEFDDGRYVHWNHKLLPHWRPEVQAKYSSGQHQPPEDIASDFYPRLGCYSSRDESVVRDHMVQFRTAQVGVLVLSWYSADKSDDSGLSPDPLVPMILRIAHEYGIKVAFHLEPYRGRSIHTVRKEIMYIIDSYGRHPAFYRYKGLPLLYIYDSYIIDASQWALLFGTDSELSLRGTPYDGYFIGLLVEYSHRSSVVQAKFDGFYTYFAASSFVYGSSWNRWPELGKFALQSNLLFIPSIGPGYTDKSIRPWNQPNWRGREDGKYYRRSFDAAMQTSPRILSITSFNEWHEGSQIEEAVPKGGQYLSYQPKAPGFYLELTAQFVSEFIEMVGLAARANPDLDSESKLKSKFRQRTGEPG